MCTEGFSGMLTLDMSCRHLFVVRVPSTVAIEYRCRLKEDVLQMSEMLRHEPEDWTLKALRQQCPFVASATFDSCEWWTPP